MATMDQLLALDAARQGPPAMAPSPPVASPQPQAGGASTPADAAAKQIPAALVGQRVFLAGDAPPPAKEAQDATDTMRSLAAANAKVAEANELGKQAIGEAADAEAQRLKRLDSARRTYATSLHDQEEALKDIQKAYGNRLATKQEQLANERRRLAEEATVDPNRILGKTGNMIIAGVTAAISGILAGRRGGVPQAATQIQSIINNDIQQQVQKRREMKDLMGMTEEEIARIRQDYRGDVDVLRMAQIRGLEAAKVQVDRAAEKLPEQARAEALRLSAELDLRSANLQQQMAGQAAKQEMDLRPVAGIEFQRLPSDMAKKEVSGEAQRYLILKDGLQSYLQALRRLEKSGSVASVARSAMFSEEVAQVLAQSHPIMQQLAAAAAGGRNALQGYEMKPWQRAIGGNPGNPFQNLQNTIKVIEGLIDRRKSQLEKTMKVYKAVPMDDFEEIYGMGGSKGLGEAT